MQALKRNEIHKGLEFGLMVQGVGLSFLGCRVGLGVWGLGG